MPQEQQPALVLLSGGMDSTVLLHHVCKDIGRSPVTALSFNYGQRHLRELECAKWQARAVMADHVLIDISFMGDLLKDGTALVSDGAAVPDLDELSDAERSQPPTYVPNRNMMLLSIAAAHAEASGIQDLYYGAQAQDEYGYWDCTPEFLNKLNETFALNRGKAVSVRAPLMKMEKTDIVRLGVELEVDFSRTWTCYRGQEKACGSCPTCVERLNAFTEAAIKDPLPYL